MQQIEPLRDCERLKLSNPCYVSSWVREACDKPEPDRIDPHIEHYWNGLCSCFRSERRGCGSHCSDHSNPTSNQLGHHVR